MSLILNITALLALIPASVLANRIGGGRTSLFWLTAGVAVAGSVLWTGMLFSDGWRIGLSAALWMTVSVSLILFVIVSLISATGAKLAPLLYPYLLAVALLATLFQGAQALEVGPARGPISGWVIAHIGLSVMTYGLATLAAIAGVAVSLLERALRAKQPTRLSRLLPAFMDGERLQFSLLLAAELVLGLGVLTGVALNLYASGSLLSLDHKTVLSLVTFGLIGGLLFAHARLGVRGKGAARLVLLAYLFLTLAYPGVKFVTDVLIG